MTASSVQPVIQTIHDPYIRVKIGLIHHQFTLFITGNHDFGFTPFVKIVIECMLNPISIRTPTNRSALALLLGKKSSAAKHPVSVDLRNKYGGLPFPSDHVGVGNMGIGNAGSVSVNSGDDTCPCSGLRNSGHRSTKVYIWMEKMKNRPVVGRIDRHPRSFRYIGLIEQGTWLPLLAVSLDFAAIRTAPR